MRPLQFRPLLESLDGRIMPDTTPTDPPPTEPPAETAPPSEPTPTDPGPSEPPPALPADPTYTDAQIQEMQSVLQQYEQQSPDIASLVAEQTSATDQLSTDVQALADQIAAAQATESPDQVGLTDEQRAQYSEVLQTTQVQALLSATVSTSPDGSLPTQPATPISTTVGPLSIIPPPSTDLPNNLFGQVAELTQQFNDLMTQNAQLIESATQKAALATDLLSTAASVAGANPALAKDLRTEAVELQASAFGDVVKANELRDQANAVSAQRDAVMAEITTFLQNFYGMGGN